jgi:hypothetical protein
VSPVSGFEVVDAGFWLVGTDLARVGQGFRENGFRQPAQRAAQLVQRSHNAFIVLHRAFIAIEGGRFRISL